jgi:uncharacterized protein
MEKKEIKKILYLVIVFLFFYFMPINSAIFGSAIISGLALLKEYTQEHILTCLIPAFFIAGAIAVFVRKDAILKYLGPQAKKTKSYLIASVSGFLLAVCSCTILPLFAGIKKRGAGLGPAITFLFSGPAINIAAIFLTISVLGAPLGLSRIVGSIIIAIAVGVSMSLIFREKAEKGSLLFEQNNSQKINKKSMLALFFSLLAIMIINGLSVPYQWKYLITTFLIFVIIYLNFFHVEKKLTNKWLSESWSFSKMILPLLFVGVFIAGFISPILPQELIEGVVGKNSFLANLGAAAFGVFMYFSTLTEIPILQELISKGMASGPALSLLLAGPSLSLPNMLVIRRVLGSKKTLVYVSMVLIYSSLTGFLFGFFI